MEDCVEEHGVARAASSFAAVFLAEVDERCRALEARLGDRLDAEVIERVRRDFDERLTSLSDEVQAGLEARDLQLEKSVSTLQEAMHGLQRDMEERKESGGDANASSAALRSFHEGLERADTERAELQCHLRELETSCISIQGRCEAELDRRGEDTRRQLESLRLLCDASMQSLQTRLVEVAEAFSKAELNGPKVSEQNHHGGSSAPSRGTLEGDTDLHEQLQAFREQLLNLSMRVSELAMGSDHQALQTLSEECRTELERHMQAVKRTEQAMDHNVMSGRQALEQLGQKQARLEQRLTGTQQLLQAELGELLEELHRLRIPVDSQRFQSVAGASRVNRVGASPDGNGPPSRSGMPLGVDGRSPVDIRGEPFGGAVSPMGAPSPAKAYAPPMTQAGSAGQGNSQGAGKPGDDACTVM